MSLFLVSSFIVHEALAQCGPDLLYYGFPMGGETTY